MLMLKQKIVRTFVEFTSSWNKILHAEIEKKILQGYNDSFNTPHEDPKEMASVINEMNSFYYQRMMNTASLLFAGASALLSVIALFVAFIALFH